MYTGVNMCVCVVAVGIVAVVKDGNVTWFSQHDVITQQDSSGGDGWNTSGLSRSSRAERTTVQQWEDGDGTGTNEGEEGEVQEGGGSLCLSATVLGALGDTVAVQVGLVRTRVGSCANSQCGGSGEGEDEVQEVQGDEDHRPCEELDEVGKQPVEWWEHQTKDWGKQGKVDPGIRVVLTMDKRTRETKDDGQEHKV